MRLNKDQIDLAAKIFADVAKILFGTAVVGFFIPGFSGAVNAPMFVIGAFLSLLFFTSSIAMLKS